MDFNIIINSVIAGVLVALIGFISGIIYKRYKSYKKLSIWRDEQMKQISKIDTTGELLSLITSSRFIPSMGQTEGPHNNEELVASENRFQLVKKLLNDFSSMNKSKGKKRYAILGGSGMGKSAFSVSLLYEYVHQFKFKKPELSFYILYLGSENVITEIEKLNIIAEEEKSIILLEALDENFEAAKDSIEFLNKVEEATSNFKFVIITSRTQLFPSVVYEPIYDEVIYISPFTDGETNKYLECKYSQEPEKIQKAKEIINHTADLMSRPMVLSFIDDLLDIKYINYITTAELYYCIIDKWLTREFDVSISSNLGLTKSGLFEFSKKLAYFLYKKSKSAISPFDFLQFIKDNGYKGDPFSFEDRSFEERSLINHDNDGNIKFSHKSFWEFFLAVLSVEQPWLSFNPDGLDTAIKFSRELNRAYLNNQTQNLSNINFYQPSFFIDYVPNKTSHSNIITELEDFTINRIYNSIDSINHILIEDSSDYSLIEVSYDILKIIETYLKEIPLLCAIAFESRDQKKIMHEFQEKANIRVPGYNFSEDLTSLEEAFFELFFIPLELIQSLIGIEDRKRTARLLLVQMGRLLNFKIQALGAMSNHKPLKFIHKESVVFNYLFELQFYTISITLLDKYLFVGHGFALDDDVFKFINDIVLKKKNLDIICILRDDADVDTHISYIKNLVLKVQNKPLLMILIISFNGKTIYYTINKKTVFDENALKLYFEYMSRLFPSSNKDLN